MTSVSARHRASQLDWTTGIPRASFSHLPCPCHSLSSASQRPSQNPLCPEIIDPQKGGGDLRGHSILSFHVTLARGQEMTFPQIAQLMAGAGTALILCSSPAPLSLLCGHCVYIVTSSPRDGWELLRHLGKVGNVAT